MRLLPEWAEQEALLLAWPHRNTDWAPWLAKVRETYIQIINAIISEGASILLLTDPEDWERVQEQFHNHAQVKPILASFNDTWVRDYGFLTLGDGVKTQPIEFTFNGWGQKFNAALDNQINAEVLQAWLKTPLISIDTVLEGGALEINAAGHLLSTKQCLLHPKRNPAMTEEDYIALFKTHLGASQVTILANGHLENDDTDAHIDTLARFTPTSGIVYQGADNCPDDSHYSGLSAMATELRDAFPDHTLFSLPLPHLVNAEGDRLPASYANFLIFNRLILMPIYACETDALAIETMQKAFATYSIVPIDCSSLVQQFGSLHCVTMQIPKGSLNL